jgi:4-amino-4-deoxy-L-arabinose transferase-like glycosyltransferase
MTALSTLEPDRVSNPTSARIGCEERRTSRSHWIRDPWVSPLVAVVLTIAARIIYLASNRAPFSADEATTGIMVRQILSGKFYTYYAGQHYGGTIEQYLQALTYIVFRLPANPFTLRVPLVLLSGLTCYITYLCARRLVGNPRAAIAALLFAVVPWFNIVGTSNSFGFYVSGQCLAILSVYLAIRVTDRDGGSLWWSLAFGLCCGLALWTSITTIYLVLPAVIWVAPIVLRRFRLSALALLALVVGSAPLWISTLITHTFPAPQAPTNPIGIFQRLGNLFGPVAREFLGLTYEHARGGLPNWLQIVLEAGLIGLFLVAAWKRRSGILRVVTLRSKDRDPADMLFLVPVFVAIGYASSASTWYVGQPRYIMTTYPAFFIAVTCLFPVKVSNAARVGACALLAGWLALTLGFFVTTTASPTLQQRDATLSRVISNLVSEHELDAYADYWTAMPLDYLASSRVQVAVCIGSLRFPSIQRAVAAHGPPVYVGSTLDGSDQIIVHALESHHVHFRARTIGFVTIYDHLSRPASPARIGL